MSFWGQEGRLRGANGCGSVANMNEHLTHTIAFRVSPSEYLDLLPFFESFETRGGSEALRWLVRHPEVRQVMAEQVTGAMNGSLPTRTANA